ncbi:MAG: helix-turn-helix domain-containing protein [Pseudomonadota bacterium]
MTSVIYREMRIAVSPSSTSHARARRIVETAAREFRAKGLDGVGVADLMAEAGLTHGGFYAHFASKDALIEAACRHGIEATVEMLSFAPARRRPATVCARSCAPI